MSVEMLIGVEMAAARKQASDKPRENRREAILDAVAATFSREKRSANEMQLVVEASGVSFEDVAAEFEDTDEIMLAVGARITERVVSHLRAEPEDAAGAKIILTAFAEDLHAAYATELVGMYRVFMTESSRRKELRTRFYDHGPRAIAEALATFLEVARRSGALDVDDCAAAAEHLMGLLREPLYRELALHAANVGVRELSARSSVDLFWRGYSNR